MQQVGQQFASDVPVDLQDPLFTAGKPTQLDVQQTSARSNAQAGNNVILTISDGRRLLLKLRERGNTAKIGKAQVSVDVLLGKQFGGLFELTFDGRHLQPINRPLDTECDDWTNGRGDDRNNQVLEDGGAAHQQLTAEDIQGLKSSGKSGEEIVAALLENSATYAGKTQFSQEKYRRKKAKKYVLQVTLCRATARSICDLYFAKSPSRICWLRADSLAILLTLANIGPYAKDPHSGIFEVQSTFKVLLVDSIGGLVTGAVAERMGGHGDIVVAHCGLRADPSDITDKFNLSPGIKQTIRRCQIRQLAEGLQGGEGQEPESEQAVSSVPVDPGSTAGRRHTGNPPDAEPARQSAGGVGAPLSPTTVTGDTPMLDASSAEIGTSGHAGNTAELSRFDAAVSTPVAADPGTQIPDAGGSDQKGPYQSAPSQPGAADGSAPAAQPAVPQVLPAPQGAPPAPADADLRQLAARGFSCCILAAPAVQPRALLAKALPLLQPSAAFAVFSPWSQPLAEAMMDLQVSKGAVALQLQESWLREQQVLPGRTHPHMTMSTTGGYILSGIKVLPD